MIAPTLSGKEFESIIIEQSDHYRSNEVASIGRSGVQASVIPDGRGGVETRLLQSLPDFEGDCLIGGDGLNLSPAMDRQHIHLKFDAKVCSSASFDWTRYRKETRGSKWRQLTYMLDRSRFGAKCFFLIHWNERKLTKSTVAPKTYIIPVQFEDPYWSRVESMQVRSLSLGDCEEMGQEVQWVLNTTRSRKYRPDFLAAVMDFYGKKLPDWLAKRPV